MTVWYLVSVSSGSGIASLSLTLKTLKLRGAASDIFAGSEPENQLRFSLDNSHVPQVDAASTALGPGRLALLAVMRRKVSDTITCAKSQELPLLLIAFCDSNIQTVMLGACRSSVEVGVLQPVVQYLPTVTYPLDAHVLWRI